MKISPSTQLLVRAAFLGGTLTLLTWLWPGRDPRLFIGVIAILGMVILWQRPVLRPVWFLAGLAAISLGYLFPTPFSPGCALADSCPPRCQVSVCTDWDAPGENGCNPPPGALGCCRSYGTTCDPNCEDDPPPDPDQPPSLTASLNCSLPGNAGWCRGGLTLDLTATESKGRQILISGEVNGTPFTCPPMAGTATCAVPLPEGAGTVNYTATSDIGLSAGGSTNYRRDSLLPLLTQSLTGSLGQNGWYVSGVTFAASAADATSGVSGLACSLDGTPQADCTVSVIAEGQHTLFVQGADIAGNTAASTQNLAIDTQPPHLSAAVNGTSGSNGWLKAATLNADAGDPTPGSGLSALEYALDGGAWTGFDGTLTIPDGVHTLATRASDLAGLLSQSEAFNVKVDTTLPELNVSETGTPGAHGWYITLPTVSASAWDEPSGLALLETSLDNGAWTTYADPLTLTEGVHTLSFWAEDAAGWVKQETRTLQVDTRPPLLGGSLSGIVGRDPLTGQVTGWYISPVTLTAAASDPLPGSGLASLTYRLNGGAETPYTSPLTLTEGENLLTLTALDLAGLPKTLPQTIRVDTLPPALQISTSLPAWVKDTVTLHGSATDGGSGLKRVEISFDNGNTWQTASGAASWQIDWDTRTGASGSLNLLLRAVDAAGLSTTLTLPAQVDNRAPRIALPAEWNIWDTVTFDAHDAESGLEGAELVISDPQNRWPRRVYRFAPGHLPVDFAWDRRFADGTLAPMGDYRVRAIATDRMGNTRVVNATLRISLTGAILPPPAVSTPLGTPRPTATPASTPTSLPSFTPIASLPTVESQTDFGEIASGVVPEPTPTATLIPRATPKTGSFSSWVASVFNPQPTPTTVTTQTVSKAPVTSAFPIPASAILWGAAAAASAGAFAALIARKKREREEKAARTERKGNDSIRDRQLRKQLGEKAYFEYKQAQELQAAIAAVTEKERKEWEAERRDKIAGEAGYAALKGVEQQQYVKQRLEEIRQEEAEWRLLERQRREEEEEEAHHGMDAKIERMEETEFNPYIGAAERIRAGANEIADEKKIGYQDVPPSQSAPDLQAGDGELDSATRSYMAWAKTIEDGKFDAQAYAHWNNAQQNAIQLGLILDRGFRPGEVDVIVSAATHLAEHMGSAEIFRQELGQVRVVKDNGMSYGGLGDKGQVILNTNAGFNSWRVTHELAHAWDANYDWGLSATMRSQLGAGFRHPVLHFLFPDNKNYWYDCGNAPPPAGIDKHFNEKEDFAESVTAYIYPAEAVELAQQRGYPYENFRETARGKFIEELLKELSTEAH